MSARRPTHGARSKAAQLLEAERLEWVALHDELRSVRERLVARGEHSAIASLDRVIHTLETHPATADYDGGYAAGFEDGRAHEVERFGNEAAARQREAEAEATPRPAPPRRPARTRKPA